MTHTQEQQIKLIRHTTPPPGHDELSYAAWQTHLGHLMAELKKAGRRVIARTRDPTVLALLDSLQDPGADPVAFGLVEHLYEFAAFHVPGPSGRTIAECTSDATQYLPEEVRGLLGPLADAHWELCEVVDLTDGGALQLRRLHDDGLVTLHATERPQPLVRGTVAAFRLFDAGGFTAAPVALVPEQAELAGLVSQLECEQPDPFETRAEYMRYRGSALILTHALRCHRRRLEDELRPMPEPQVSVVESDLPTDAWKRLDAAFSLLEGAVSGCLSGVTPLVLALPDGGVCSVERNGAWPALTLFESADEQREWQQTGRASRFVRVWRAGAEELFAEDVAELEKAGLDPPTDGAAVAIRLEKGVWEDVDETHIDRLVEACRWIALRVQADGELAA